MKRRLRYYIFLHFLLFMMICVVVFLGLHYGVVKNNLKAVEETRVVTENQIVAAKLEESLGALESETLYLGKELTYGEERPIYLIQSFLQDHNGIQAIYLYDEGKQKVGVHKEVDGYDEIITRTLSDLFFYSPIVWTKLEDNIYSVYHRVTSGKDYYIGYVIDLREYLDVLTSERVSQFTLYDSYGRVVAYSQNGRLQQLSNESYKNEMLNGQRKVIQENGLFVAFQPLMVDGVDLLLYHQQSDQAFRGALRQYMVKIIAGVLFLITIGLLIAWKLINKVYAMMTMDALKQNGNTHEFSKIKEELGKAIVWIDDVVMHYDELNALKEELVELNTRLPKEDDGHVKQSKKHKDSH